MGWVTLLTFILEQVSLGTEEFTARRIPFGNYAVREILSKHLSPNEVNIISIYRQTRALQNFKKERQFKRFKNLFSFSVTSKLTEKKLQSPFALPTCETFFFLDRFQMLLKLCITEINM